MASFRDAQRSRRRSPARRPRLPLQFESLEPRTLLAAWAPQGPAPAIDGQVRNVLPDNQVSGAIHAVVAHPTDSNVMYLGAVNGGIWKTTDAQADEPTWTPLTDDFPSLSIGALEFDPTDASRQTLVAGVGHFSSFGRTGGTLSGLLHTTDGGDNWDLVADEELRGRSVSGLAVRGDLLLVATNRFGNGVAGGVYCSVDGGDSFEYLAGTRGLPLGDAFDLVADPTNANRFYVSIAQTGVFRTNDQGETWENITTISNSNGGLFEAITQSGNNNTEIAMGSDGRIYVGVAVDGQIQFIGYSANFGAIWTKMDLPETREADGDFVGLNPRAKPGGQGGIHFAIAVDPNDPNIIYVGGDRQDGPYPNFLRANGPTGRLFRGDARAVRGPTPSPQWKHLTHRNDIAAIPGGGTANNSAPHADSREIVFDAAGNLVEVDDGGIYRRTSPQTNAGDWFSLNGNLAVTEFHDIAYDKNSQVIFGGAQDTGTPVQLTPGAKVWDSISTADGGDVAVDDFGTPGLSTRYTSFQDLAGFRRRVYDANNNLMSTSAPPLAVVDGGAAVVTQFVTPLELNAVDPNRLIIGGANSVYETLDQGETISEIGPGIAANRDAIAYGGQSSAEANADVLYVGSENRVYIRTAAGQAIQPTSSEFPGSSVRDIVLDPADWMTAVVIDTSRVFQTKDAGDSWTELTGNLVDASLRAIEMIGGSVARLVVGGLGGVFAMSLDQPGIWGEFGDPLPNAPVFDLDYDPDDDVLVAGTLGRGAFLLADASLEAPVFAPEIFVRPSSPVLTVNEDGRTASLDLFLTAEPTESVTIPISSSDPLEASVDVSQVVYTPADWYLPQTVTITGVDDLQVDGDVELTIQIGPASSETASDVRFHGLDADDVRLVNLDRDQAGFVYWLDHGDDVIRRSSSDGSDAQPLIDLRAQLNDVADNIEPRYLVVDEDARKLYWTDSSRGEILRADLTGSNVETVVIGYLELRGIAIDSSAGKLYWVDAEIGSIQRANLDGTGLEVLAFGDLSGARELELDPGAGKIYWADNENDWIRRSNLDGSSIETVVRNPGAGPTGLDLDLINGKMYWSDITDDRILRADLDGGNMEVVVDLRELDDSSSVAGVATDLRNDRVYWSDLRTGAVYRSSLDGSHVATVAEGYDLPQGVVTTGRSPGISPLAPAGVITGEDKTTATLQVTLDTAPSESVTIPVSSDDVTEGIVEPAELIFDATNWNEPQIVTISGVDDLSLDGDIDYTILFGTPVTGDTDYQALESVVVRATNLENDVELLVTSLVPTSVGFEIQFSAPFDTAELNLYDTELLGLGPADIVLQGQSGGPVAGSVVLDPPSNTATFIKTGGPLDPDTYTVTVRSGTEGFKTVSGILLDGNEDGTVGDDFVTTFSVGAALDNAVTVGIPDFVRGPGQDVNLPADIATGIPLTLSDGANVRAVELQLAYNPALLQIDSATVASGLPAGTTVSLDTTTPGLAVLSLLSPIDLPGGPLTFANLQAAIPVTGANDIYRAKQVLDLHTLAVRDGDDNSLPTIDDDGLHVTAYPGDLSGNGQINSIDAARVARVSVQLDHGFSVARLVDPILLGDATGNGVINSLDASRVAQFVAGLAVSDLPEAPLGVVTRPTIVGPDPRLSISRTLIASAGQTIRVPLTIDSIINIQPPNRLVGADLVVLYDNQVLTANSVEPGEFISRFPNWSIFSDINNTVGVLTGVAFTASPLVGQFSDVLAYLNFTVNANAPDGPTMINLAESAVGKFTDLVDENDGFFELEGPVTNAATDSVDGVVTIVSSATAWTNPENRLDVDSSGVVSSNDVLVTINELNVPTLIDSSNRLPDVRNPGQFFYDVDGDGFATAIDVLTIINHLNFSANGEGEGGGTYLLHRSDASAAKESIEPITRDVTPELLALDELFHGWGRESDSPREPKWLTGSEP
jgi:photosystem II stability/assembly factor-like uncharacterized protein